MVSRLTCLDDIILENGLISVSKNWGFSSPDSHREAYVFETDFDSVLCALDSTLGIEQHLSNVYGKTVSLFDRKYALLYRLKGYKYIILDIDQICLEQALDIRLRILSELLPAASVARFFTGEEAGYVIYRNGILEKCFIPAFSTIKGYEDLTGRELWDYWGYLVEASDVKRQECGRDENPPMTSTYYHVIDRIEDIDSFVIKEEITADRPYPRGRIMDRLGIYIPEFLPMRDSESSNNYMFDFLEMGKDPFDRIDCLWFSQNAYLDG
ncbi:hypothetical protein [Adonisia turfae]|uniref:Uncharacterized protein n=1 Tax=Adonisia turfae CCMR0081 TaxID=2292702 RepID=A0A6M0RF54_9CYAN|nr:hypothetical protein [Adonisia turfae]NEZ54493.1 hypothetical protein [Adonisia turfae CCMR0081]